MVEKHLRFLWTVGVFGFNKRTERIVSQNNSSITTFFPLICYKKIILIHENSINNSIYLS